MVSVNKKQTFLFLIDSLKFVVTNQIRYQAKEANQAKQKVKFKTNAAQKVDTDVNEICCLPSPFVAVTECLRRRQEYSYMKLS